MMKDVEYIELRMRYLDLRTVDLDAGWLGLMQIMKGPSLEPIVVYRIGQSFGNAVQFDRQALIMGVVMLHALMIFRIFPVMLFNKFPGLLKIFRSDVKVYITALPQEWIGIELGYALSF